MQVTKRDGSLEPLNSEKIYNNLASAASIGNLNIDINLLIEKASISFFDGISTNFIHDVMIKTADDLSELKKDRIDYDKMSANLLMFKIYKEVFKDTEPVRLESMLQINIDRGIYSKTLLSKYSKNDIHRLSNTIDYSRNFLFSKAGLQTLLDKYIIKRNGLALEDPQTMFMAISMAIFEDYKGLNKLNMVKAMYDALSQFKVSLPTPMMKNLRTGSFDIASCIVIETDDSIESWTQTFNAIVEHTCASAGIGEDASMLASIGDLVKNGKIIHSGKIPFYRAVDSLIGTSSQMGRRGAAVVHTYLCDLEIETILALKSPKTETAKRINDLKHTIKVNQFLIDKAINDEYIYLMSPRVARDMYKVFHDNEKFKILYDNNVKNKKYSSKIKARELFEKLIDARVENGVYYLFFADNVNRYSSFKNVIKCSNLCMEIALPTLPLTNKIEPAIAVCVLSNINMSKVRIDELRDYTKLLVYALNEIIHKQSHPTKHANMFIKEYAALGVGVSNGAYFLAKNEVKYGSEEALALIDEYMEAFSYNLIRASAEYSRDFDACAPKFYKSKYSNYNFLAKRQGKLDWEYLAKFVIENGMANTALSSIPPSETSSVIGSQTSSIEPIKEPLTIKDSKSGQIKQYAPEALNLIDKYDYAFDTIDLTTRYLKTVSVFQKWIDQSISTQTFYNKELYENKKIPFNQIWSDIKLAKELNLKTLYYNNIKRDNNEDLSECENCTV